MSKITAKKFKISGLHCKSCKILLETEVGSLPGVKNIQVDFLKGSAEILLDEKITPWAAVVKRIEKFDYQVGAEAGAAKRASSRNIMPLIMGLLMPVVMAGLIFAYFYLQNSGALSLLARLNEKNIGYGLIFLIGLLASFHCIGMCGGLVVCYSAGIAVKDRDNRVKNYWPHLQYNFGRLISYAIVGGILGGIGSFFAVTPAFSGALMLLAGMFMLLMALSLFTNFKWLESLKPRTPEFIARFIFKSQKSDKPKTPLAIGLLSGLMPCGPLQAMQLYALASGSPLRGALSLGVYALGTIPLMFGFGTLITSISKKFVTKAMKISALIVALLAVLMIGRGLANFGITTNINSDSQAVNSGGTVQANGYQIVRMAVTYSGYQPSTLYIKKGVPVRWIINGSGITGCTNAIQIPSLGIKKNLTRGENIIEFTPTKTGEIPFSCWMQMVWGKFIVTDDGVAPSGVSPDQQGSISPGAGIGCGGSGTGGGCGCGGSGGCGTGGGCGCGSKIL